MWNHIKTIHTLSLRLFCFCIVSLHLFVSHWFSLTSSAQTLNALARAPPSYTDAYINILWRDLLYFDKSVNSLRNVFEIWGNFWHKKRNSGR